MSEVTRPLMESPPGRKVKFNGEEYLYFAGTSYYALHSKPQIINASQQAMAKYGSHSATSRGGFGNSSLILELEAEAAKFFATDDAAYIATGYLSNMAGIQALNSLRAIDCVFIDEFAHYSNKDAAYSLGKPVITFANGDMEQLSFLLKTHCSKNSAPLIVTDGVYSITGELPPLLEMAELANDFNARVWIDDAHGIGVLGKNNRGIVQHFGPRHSNIYFGGTLAKAFGGFGGIIPGNKEFIDAVKSGPTFNGGSYFAPAAAASLTGLKIVRSNPTLSDKLKQNATYLKEQLSKLGIETIDSEMPIVAWKLGNTDEMKSLQQLLFDHKIAIQHVQYVGTDPEGVLRAVVCSEHTKDDIELLCKMLSEFR